MTLRQRYRTILAAIVPAGAVGASLLLGALAPGTAKEDPLSLQPRAAVGPAVADRLVAVRQAVSDIAGGGAARDGQHLAWWGNWRNGGSWGPGWRNGGWWGPGWRNGGWGNGGWRNGGWRNGGWPNFWRNW